MVRYKVSRAANRVNRAWDRDGHIERSSNTTTPLLRGEGRRSICQEGVFSIEIFPGYVFILPVCRCLLRTCTRSTSQSSPEPYSCPNGHDRTSYCIQPSKLPYQRSHPLRSTGFLDTLISLFDPSYCKVRWCHQQERERGNANGSNRCGSVLHLCVRPERRVISKVGKARCGYRGQLWENV